MPTTTLGVLSLVIRSVLSVCSLSVLSLIVQSRWSLCVWLRTLESRRAHSAQTEKVNPATKCSSSAASDDTATKPEPGHESSRAGS